MTRRMKRYPQDATINKLPRESRKPDQKRTSSTSHRCTWNWNHVSRGYQCKLCLTWKEEIRHNLITAVKKKNFVIMMSYLIRSQSDVRKCENLIGDGMNFHSWRLLIIVCIKVYGTPPHPHASKTKWLWCLKKRSYHWNFFEKEIASP